MLCENFWFQNDRHIAEIVETESGAEEAEAVKNLRRMYKGCMDTDAIEATGLYPVLEGMDDPDQGFPIVQQNWQGNGYELKYTLETVYNLINEWFKL